MWRIYSNPDPQGYRPQTIHIFLPFYFVTSNCTRWFEPFYLQQIKRTRVTSPDKNRAEVVCVSINRPSPAEKPTFLGEPSNVVYRFVLDIKRKLRTSRFRICTMPPYHLWAFCAIQDGVQDGRHFKQTDRTPLLFDIERWFSCQTLCFRVKEFIEMVN
jgi:hypothetical protein